MLLENNCVIYTGGRKASRSIASLTCLVLRKCLPQLPLPLPSLKNPIPFSLPLVQGSRETENLISPSSSTKSTTTSELSVLFMCSEKEEQEKGSGEDEEEEEEEEEEDVQTSAESTFEPSPPTNNVSARGESLQKGGLPEPKLMETPSLTHPPIPKSPPREAMNADNENYYPSNVSSYADCTEVKININLDLYRKYFPELEDSEESLSTDYLFPPSKLASSQEPKATGADSGKDGGKFPVVVVPTAVQMSESLMESLNESKEGETKVESSVALFKTSAYFVEEPEPQILGHMPPMKSELMYTKTPSVDR